MGAEAAATTKTATVTARRKGSGKRFSADSPYAEDPDLAETLGDVTTWTNHDELVPTSLRQDNEQRAARAAIGLCHILLSSAFSTEGCKGGPSWRT